MLTGQNSQLVFDLEVLQTHGACLLCEAQGERGFYETHAPL